ncbi:hypothetical protein SCHPADRAFT_941645 [Schizopora paradoxa]|uniref:Uncharacterized protein n=1 Tax=Schizopora paradoxa TaxID=27342 RepID=A0A0H2RK11_9AGAM|nr:hypothetical protein SCHPADRAFT_941645 [Schizopora paradoxa]
MIDFVLRTLEVLLRLIHDFLLFAEDPTFKPESLTHQVLLVICIAYVYVLFFDVLPNSTFGRFLITLFVAKPSITSVLHVAATNIKDPLFPARAAHWLVHHTMWLTWTLIRWALRQLRIMYHIAAFLSLVLVLTVGYLGAKLWVSLERTAALEKLHTDVGVSTPSVTIL